MADVPGRDPGHRAAVACRNPRISAAHSLAGRLVSTRRYTERSAGRFIPSIHCRHPPGPTAAVLPAVAGTSFGLRGGHRVLESYPLDIYPDVAHREGQFQARRGAVTAAA